MKTGMARQTHRAAEYDDARDSLLREHLGLVHHVARRLGARCSAEVELDELVSAGTMGLLQASASFDAARGLAFSTFAVPRIRGAILDELRRQDPVPRSVRRKSRELRAARESLAARLGRAPSDAELARELKLPESRLRRWRFDIAAELSVPLELAPGEDEVGRPQPAATLAAAEEPSIEELLTHEQEIARMREAIASLGKQERSVLSLAYYEELSLSEIAGIMRLSACRISQIRSAALTKLRQQLSSLRAA